MAPVSSCDPRFRRQTSPAGNRWRPPRGGCHKRRMNYPDLALATRDNYEHLALISLPQHDAVAIILCPSTHAPGAIPQPSRSSCRTCLAPVSSPDERTPDPAACRRLWGRRSRRHAHAGTSSLDFPRPGRWLPTKRKRWGKPRLGWNQVSKSKEITVHWRLHRAAFSLVSTNPRSG